jgi:adenosylmethionine-8-amino-7-oxononanoate aminotransferase
MALKLLRAHAVATGHPERHRVISLMPGYHGATLQTLALNGDVGVPALWGPLAVESEKIPAPLTFRAPSAEAAADASCAALDAAIARIGPERVLLVAPPLVIDEATCDELIDRLDATLTAATPDVLASIDRRPSS